MQSKPKILNLHNSAAPNSGTPTKYEGSKDSYVIFQALTFCIEETRISVEIAKQFVSQPTFFFGFVFHFFWFVLCVWVFF